MRILLVGEYSNVHHTLALGLRRLGHDVTVASDGDDWKDYPRDVDLCRRSTGLFYSIYYYIKLWFIFRSFRDYDVVQIIGADFLPLKAQRIKRFYNLLRRQNKYVVLGAYGMDYYYIKACLDKSTFRYSDFNFAKEERISAINDRLKKEWFTGEKGILNRYLAQDVDGIVAGLYEYAASYRKHYEGKAKMQFIPFPIILPETLSARSDFSKGEPLKIFIGIQRTRSVYKGTDIMLRAARRVKAEYEAEVELQIAENVPFAQYVKMLEGADVILDQLYSYTPAMNALEAMACGLVAVSGGEEEYYEDMGEARLRPVVNVLPTEQNVYDTLKSLVAHRAEIIPLLRKQSREFLLKHHEYVQVARRYAEFYKTL